MFFFLVGRGGGNVWKAGVAYASRSKHWTLVTASGLNGTVCRSERTSKCSE